MWSLGEALPAPAVEGRGRRVFEAECARCHAGDGLAGGPIPLGEVGTDDTVGRSPARTTGSWRVPSLRGVADRSLLFAGGSVRGGVEELLDPARVAPGHAYGLDLDADDRRALLDFLLSL